MGRQPTQKGPRWSAPVDPLRLSAARQARTRVASRGTKPCRASPRCARKDPTYRVSAPKTMPSANTTPAMVVPVFTGFGMV